jgi:Flp pilus assembly pilin Flp
MARRGHAATVGRGDGAGQGLVEYTLILALIAIVAIVALVFFGDAIAALLQIIGDEIDKAS